MILRGSRAELEAYLVKALSRYIGYTTGAFDLDRIFSVLELFGAAPSAYQTELVDFLRKKAQAEEKKVPSDKYLNEIIGFATSMQIIEIVSDHDARVRRLAPTELGRSIMGAKNVEDKDYYYFFLTNIVLMADADALVSVLLLDQNNKSSTELRAAYQNFHFSIRKRRLSWLYEAFPERRLLERIADQLPWLTRQPSPAAKYEVSQITLNTARHHTNPRRDWLVRLGLVAEQGRALTGFGSDVLETLTPNGDYFWLGPPSGLQEALRIPEAVRKGGPYEDKMAFCPKPRDAADVDVQELIEDTSEVMLQGYEAAKLVYAPQASLHLPIAYIRYRIYRDHINYEWPDVLEKLFKQKRPVLERLSARKGPIGFYKARSPGRG
jgi:hypothetical protein